MNEFIATCPFEGPGARAEEIVWEKLKEALKEEEVLAYYQYPLFAGSEECKRQPDILIFHRQWGIMIIEVKGLEMKQIKKVRGGQWEVKGYFDKPYINPGKQAEKQLEVLMKKFTYRKLVGKIPVKIVVAVPYIEKKEWVGKGLVLEDQPLLFKDEMGPKTLKQWLKDVPLLYGQGVLSDVEWELLLSKVGGIQVQEEEEAFCGDEGCKASIRAQVESEIHKLDIQQERIAKVIPPGPQRIRGIAGSGKTILLCQRAVHMHLKHPDWKIAIVFQTKSLYNSMTRYVKRYMESFTEGEQTYNPDGNLQILHAWGGRWMKGLYSEICKANRIKALTVRDVKGVLPEEESYNGFFYVCNELLRETGGTPEPCYDAILIDEGQDLVAPETYKYEGKQPFYWMAYKSIRTKEGQLPCMTWAYDELQDLNTIAIPSYKEIFGVGKEVEALTKGVVYSGNIKKSEIMKKCYRTPYQILVAAHALGMGIFRKEGVLSCFTNQKEWGAVGYEVIEGAFNRNGHVKIMRPKNNNLNTIEAYEKQDLITVSNYTSQERMYEALGMQIKVDLESGGLSPDRDILIVQLGYKSNQVQLMKGLNKQGVHGYIPKMPALDKTYASYKEMINDRFWMKGGVTIAQTIDAKGNEAPMVYVVGVDYVYHENQPYLEQIKRHNQLFVAMTRAKCWVHLMGVNMSQDTMEEIKAAVTCKGVFEFDYNMKDFKRIMDQEG